MADAKKSSKKSETKAPKSPASGASSAPALAASNAKKGAAKKVEKPAAAGMPLIDTSNAAEAAAKMIGNKLTSMGGGSATRHESAAFRQLKEGLNKPASQGAASFIQSTAPTKKSSQHFGGPNQVRHNQTFGADVNRAGVPRRTGGG